MDAALDIKKAGVKKRYPRLSFTGNYALYWIIFIAALVFTQALRSKASNLLFGFVFFLPWVMALYLLTSRSAVRVVMLTGGGTISKLEPYEYAFRVINESFVPYPFIDAIMTLPQHNSVRCTERVVRLAMSPFSSYEIKNRVRFRFRGTYEIGVNCIYVYDFFRMMRLRIDIDVTNEVAVLPRRLVMREGDVNAVADSARETRKDPHSYEKIEISDIRDYRTGDPLKSIHWKLSSKAEDFMVRDYDTGSSKKTYVFCDLSAHYPAVPPEREIADGKKDNKKNNEKTKSKVNGVADAAGRQAGIARADGGGTDNAEKTGASGIDAADVEKKTVAPTAALERGEKNRGRARSKKKNALEIDRTPEISGAVSVDVDELAEDMFYDDMNEFCADGIVELGVAVVLRELRDGNECMLFWFDRRSDTGFFCVALRGLEDFNTVYRLFATAPLCAVHQSVEKLAHMVSDIQDVKQLYITSAIDPDSVRRFGELPGVADGGSGAAEIILYNPEERFAHRSERRLYIEGCRAQLHSRGMKLSESKINAGG